MKKQERPKFYALEKDFNDGKVKPIEVLRYIFDEILTSRGALNAKKFYIFDARWEKIPVRTKEQLQRFIEKEFRYHFWSTIDWPHRDTIDASRPVKIDVFDQLKPNLPVITETVWNYLEPKIKKLIEKENE